MSSLASKKIRVTAALVFAVLALVATCLFAAPAKALATDFNHPTSFDKPASSVSTNWAKTFEGLNLESRLTYSVPFYVDGKLGWYLWINWDLASAKKQYDPSNKAKQAFVVKGKIQLDYGMECDDESLLDVSATVTVKAKPEKEAGTITVNTSKVTSAAINKAIAKAYTSSVYADASTVKTIVLGSKCKTVCAKAFKSFKNVKTVVVGKNVKKLKSKAFASSSVKTVTLKSKKLAKKSAVKGAFASSKVTKAKVAVSGKAFINNKYAKKYKKALTKKNAGKKLKVVR